MPSAVDEDPRFAARRREMVEKQLEGRGIKDRRVLAAMELIPRHRFVEASLVEAAYEDRPLPIGQGQTISQPFMVARATELAAPRPGDRALEVGAGCGYQLAVLAHLCDRVLTVSSCCRNWRNGRGRRCAIWESQTRLSTASTEVPAGLRRPLST